VSVFKRPNGKWVAQVYDPVTRRPRQVGTFATRREARRAESDAMDRRTATGRETVASFAARWPEDYPRPRASTNVHNAERVKPFAKAYERRRMDSITVEEARSWAVRHRGQLLSLRAMFNDARRSGMVINNPFRELGIERSRGRRDLASEWLTAKDVERLAQCGREVHADSGYGDTMAGLLVFAAYTGLRPGELYALRRDDLGAQTLEVKRAADSRTRALTMPKNGRARTVVYPARAREAVESVPQLLGVELVFPGPSGVQLWSSSFSWLWKPVRAAFGRPSMALHELRHFCATYLLELGLAPADVAVQLGHTDGGALVMSTYGHPSDRAARARITAALDGDELGELRPFRGGSGS
jgi:integrase